MCERDDAKPKWIIHTTASYLVDVSTTHHYMFDIKPDSVGDSLTDPVINLCSRGDHITPWPGGSIRADGQPGRRRGCLPLT